MRSTGHVFVVQGDLARLRTDAWLLPTDRSLGIIESWIPKRWSDQIEFDHAGIFEIGSQDFHDWLTEKKRVVEFPDWPGKSRPWLANVAGHNKETPHWYLEAVSQFVSESVEWARATTSRIKPLLGVPAVGTGFSGRWSEKAAVLQAVFEHLCELAERFDTDIVFTLYDAPSFAAAQFARQKLVSQNTYSWDIEEHLIPVAKKLGKRAQRGEIVMFMGAGVSVGAGLPTWKSFLRQLGEQAQFTPEELDALQDLDAMDAGSLLERRLGGRQNLKAIIKEMLDVEETSLQHALIASIPHEAAVTLNYDRLYEIASERVVGDIAVLPHDRGMNAKRWLLKLHGCIDRGRLVLAREDYLRFGERRTALAGIVQALLITKHMLFVGFGMTDANFLRILDDVRRSLGDTTSEKDLKETIGTVLMLRPEPLRNALFDGDLEIQAMYSGTEHAGDVRHSARQLEIFLDLILHHSAAHSAFFFDKSFDAMLSDHEREFRDALLELYGSGSSELKGTPIWEWFSRFMHKSGMK